MATPKPGSPDLDTAKRARVWRDDLDFIIDQMLAARDAHNTDKPVSRHLAPPTIEDFEFVYSDLDDVRTKRGDVTRELSLTLGTKTEGISVHLRGVNVTISSRGTSFLRFARNIDERLDPRQWALMTQEIVFALLAFVTSGVAFTWLREATRGPEADPLSVVLSALMGFAVAQGMRSLYGNRYPGVHLAGRSDLGEFLRPKLRGIVVWIATALAAGAMGAYLHGVFGG